MARSMTVLLSANNLARRAAETIARAHATSINRLTVEACAPKASEARPTGW